MQFYTLFDLLVVERLYGFSLLFMATPLLKFRRLRLRENLDIIVELKGLVA